MPSMNDAFPSKYLSAEDLNGLDHTVVITHYATDTLKGRDGQDELKYIFFFQNHKKGLVMNKTNGKTITALVGSSNFDDWIGKAITIGTAWVDSFGEQVLSIRVRPGLASSAQTAQPQTAQQAAQPTAQAPAVEAPEAPPEAAGDLDDGVGDIPF